MDDRALRVAIIVIGHGIWLSTAALRVLRGQRAHGLRADVPWLVRYYPPLVWIPFLVPTLLVRTEHEIADELQAVGVAVALAGSAFAAWGMWSLGRAYGIGVDLFEGHRLKTDGPFAVVRHPMYLGILVYHLGAALALQSVLLLALTALVVLPYTAARIAYEDRVLREGFGEAYLAYARRTPALLPLSR